MIESERKHRQKQLLENPRNAEKIQKLSEKEKKEMETDLTGQAEEAVKLFYISRKVVRDAKISVTHQEVTDEAIRTLQSFGPVKVDPNKIPNEIYALALSKIVLAKAQNHILEGKKKA